MEDLKVGMKGKVRVNQQGYFDPRGQFINCTIKSEEAVDALKMFWVELQGLRAQSPFQQGDSPIEIRVLPKDIEVIK